ncbi:MAG: thioredoxin, partial [Clostridia bacterium]|nr:thioredoxin [Clostridia bacterium]
MTDFEIKITDRNFDSVVNGADKPLLIDFYADWCGPCQMLSPIISEIAQSRQDITVGKVNVDENPTLSARFSVMSIPMLVVIKNGEVTAQNIGYCDKEKIES